MCLAQVSGTFLVYFNIPIAIFDRAIFKNYFCFFISVTKIYICTGKTTFLPFKKQDHCLMTQWKVEIFTNCLGRIHFGFEAVCIHVFQILTKMLLKFLRVFRRVVFPALRITEEQLILGAGSWFKMGEKTTMVN